MHTNLEPDYLPPLTDQPPILVLERQPASAIWITVQPVAEAQPIGEWARPHAEPALTDRLEDATWEDAEWR